MIMNHWYEAETRNDAQVQEWNRIYTDEMTRVHWMQSGFEEFMVQWDREHRSFWIHVAEHIVQQACSGDEECAGHAMEVFHNEMALIRDVGREDLREFFMFVQGLSGAAPKTIIIKCVDNGQGMGYSHTQMT